MRHRCGCGCLSWLVTNLLLVVVIALLLIDPPNRRLSIPFLEHVARSTENRAVEEAEAPLYPARNESSNQHDNSIPEDFVLAIRKATEQSDNVFLKWRYSVAERSVNTQEKKRVLAKLARELGTETWPFDGRIVSTEEVSDCLGLDRGY